jgi:hypothetical protein
MSKQELFNKTLEAKKSMQLALDHIQATKHNDGEYERGMRNAFADCARWIDELYSETDEPKITDKQAWNKIAEAYPESVHSLRNTLDNAVFSHKDEPKKEVVPLPKKVVSFIDNLKCMGIGISEIYEHIYELEYYENGDVFDWFQNEKNSDNLMRALVTEYEIEKEQLYYVELTHINYGGLEAYLMKTEYGIEIADNNDFDDMKFTESEIKAIDERYWPFAVKVED